MPTKPAAENAAAADPDHEREAGRRLRPPPGQALGRRPGRRAGDGVPRRARDPRRAGPLPRPGREALALGAARAALERPLHRLVRGRRGRPLGVPRRGVERPRRDLARRAAPQGRGRRGGPHERAGRGRGAARREEASTVEKGLASTKTDKHGTVRSARARARRRPRCSAASAPGTSSSRAPSAASRASRRCCRSSPSSASTSSTSRRSTRSAQRAQGPQQHAAREGGRPGQPVGDRLGGGRPRRDPSRARHARRLRPARRGREGARPRDRARLRDPVLARPPVAEGASRVVPAPARRDDQVRREPAQEVPGHRQRRLGVRGLARAVGGAARRRPALDGARHPDLPRRQPAHEAAAVLGVADRRGARGRRRRDLPRRGVHEAGDDARARQGRDEPVVHVLHVAERALGAAGVHDRARDRGRRLLPAELLRQHAGHPHRLPRRRRAAGVRGAARARGDAVAEPTASTPATRTSRTCRCGRAARSTSTRRSTS